MSTYRTEWPCCQSVTETEAWIPSRCPFCEPEADDAVLALARFGAEIARRWWLGAEIPRTGFHECDLWGDRLGNTALNDVAISAGLIGYEYAPHFAPRPGIAEAMARLAGGDA